MIENVFNNHRTSFAIVIDTGSYACKVGAAGNIVPQHEIRTIVGRPKYPEYSTGVNSGKDVFVGEDVLKRLQILNVSYPLPSRSLVSNWEDLEHIWSYAFFTKLKIDPSHHPILLSEASCVQPKATREKIAEVMFDAFDAPALFISHQAILSLYASEGKITGCVIDMGNSSIDIVPVYEGFVLSHAIQHMSTGGQKITEYLEHLLKMSGKLTSRITLDLVQDIKENVCFVSYRRNKIPYTSEFCYECPGGAFIKLKSERAQCCEVLFNPKLFFKTTMEVPLHTKISESLSKCQQDIQESIATACVLVGSSSLFPGLRGRLETELNKVCSESSHQNTTLRFQVLALGNRQFAAWTGGSLIASLSSFQNVWITKEKYMKRGPSILHETCFF